MNRLDHAIAQLRGLPSALQMQALTFIEQLHASTRAERLDALQKTSGSLVKEAADLFEEAIRESCERLNE